MVEYDLPDKDDAPWLNSTHDGFMTHEEMIEIAKQREEENIILAKISDDDLRKVQDALKVAKKGIKEYKPALEELAQKSFEELTKDQKIQLALEEIDWIVIGGQDGEEFYNSIQFLRKVLESLK